MLGHRRIPVLFTLDERDEIMKCLVTITNNRRLLLDDGPQFGRVCYVQCPKSLQLPQKIRFEERKNAIAPLTN